MEKGICKLCNENRELWIITGMCLLCNEYLNKRVIRIIKDCLIEAEIIEKEEGLLNG
jgi:hypothetical protein